LIRFSDLIHTLSIAQVTPIVIIYACYSGAAGKAIYDVVPGNMIGIMNNDIHNQHASSYALLCSCREDQVTEETRWGVIFSNYVFHVANKGIGNQKPSKKLLGLQDIYPPL